MVRQMCYNTSRDMKRLKELLDQGYDVVCFYSYDWNRFNKDKPDYKPMPSVSPGTTATVTITTPWVPITSLMLRPWPSTRPTAT